MCKGIIINCIVLGYINIEMVVVVLEKVFVFIIGGILVNCFGEVDEIVKVVVYLVGDDVGFMIGLVMIINGG